MKGLSFAVLALVNVDDRKSRPVHLSQIVPSHALNPVVTTIKRPRGRPLGSRNKPHQDQPLSPELARIDTQITQFLHEKNNSRWSVNAHTDARSNAPHDLPYARNWGGAAGTTIAI